eukprot:CAMPEP_0198137908 /NCGR_PEP_ID=MMETSP1443-20131203/1339_1 /TAXON_ID=186043 /ORGANISM="Entomoneis sp., Strain CCMP2396" /LENGTH=423 /DNA_ID=CAMNT_0043799481 /DNA_START=229 /DNA_END=1500 /DNA_ORIENTATION=-
MDVLRRVFADKLDINDSEPLHTFSIPGLEGQTYALYAPNGGLWNQLIVALLIQLFFQIVFAVLIYKLIVQKRGSSSSFITSPFLLGYGVIMPVALYIPFEIMEFLLARNRSVKMGFALLPTIVCFRCIEAMHGTSPAAVENSLTNYVTYYTTVSHFEWDEKTMERRKITAREIGVAFVRIVYFFTAASLWLSFLIHVNYQPMESTVALDSFHLSFDLLHPAHLINTYCLLVLVYFVLATGFELTTFGEQIKGYATKPIFDNPLFSSRSIREFWGKKWDLMIHRVLKHGAFLPARKVFAESGYTPAVSNGMGTLAAFFASGLLHEYTWACIFYEYRDDDECEENCFSPLPSKLTLFFLYNCVTMLIEHYYGRHLTFFESWPSIIVSTLLVLTALPVSHWYSGDWVVGGYFDDFSVGLWHIKRVD